VKHRILRAAAAVAAVGLVAACAAPGSTPAASNGKAPPAATASAPATTPAPVASEARHIVVRPGQSVSRIAAQYGVSRGLVIAANHLTPPYKVKIGQRLLIPGAAAASAAAPPAAVASDARHIVVRPGQSVSRLAAEHGVARAAIIDANHLTPPYKVKIGQRLLIPNAAATPDATPLEPVTSEARHIVVQPGQSVSRLAVQYHVPRHAIIAANQLTPPYKVKIGQRLLIPGAAAAPPAAVAAGAPPPETIPADAPAPAKSAALRPVATSPVTAPPPAGAAAQASATSADNKSPVVAEPLHAPVAQAPIPVPTTTTGKPSEPSGPAAAPPEPAATASAQPPTAEAVPAAAAPGVSCPPGTIGVTERDVIKMPVFVCHRLHAQE